MAFDMNNTVMVISRFGRLFHVHRDLTDYPAEIWDSGNVYLLQNFYTIGGIVIGIVTGHCLVSN